MPCLRCSRSQRASLVHKTLICLNFQDRGLRRAFILLLTPPPSFNIQTVHKNQWIVVGKVYSSHVLGIPLIWGFHYMPHLYYVHSGNWPVSWSSYRWSYEWCYAVAWFPDIESWWGVFKIGLRRRASLGPSGTQWGIGISWPPGRWLPVTPSPVVAFFKWPTMIF